MHLKILTSCLSKHEATLNTHTHEHKTKPNLCHVWSQHVGLYALLVFKLFYQLITCLDIITSLISLTNNTERLSIDKYTGEHTHTDTSTIQIKHCVKLCMHGVLA